MEKKLRILFVIFAVAIAAASCSTTRVLKDNEYMLADNKITVLNDDEFKVSSLKSYLRQQPSYYFIFRWNPFINVYNWQNGKGGMWDKFVKKIGVEPVVYDSEKVEESIENISNRLENLGYYGSKIDANLRLKKKRVFVDYNITLGKRFPIKDIILTLPEGSSAFAADYLADTSAMLIKPGDYLSENILEKETVRSTAVMNQKGYFNFTKQHFFFEADTLSIPDTAILKMDIRNYSRTDNPDAATPIRKFYFNEVSISYPATVKFRDKVLKELNTVKPGEVYSTDIVNNTYSRLSALRTFSSVNVGLTQVDTNLVNCNINLSQSKLQGFKVNLEASTNSTGLFGVSPQLSYFHKNIFRGGEWLNLSFMGNFQFKFNDDIRSNEFGISSGISIPRFLLLPYRYFKQAVPRTEVNLSYNYQSRPEYTRNIISTSYGYNGNVHNRFFYQVYPVQLNIVNLYDMDENFYKSMENDPFFRNAYQNHFDLGLGGTLYYTTNPEPTPNSTYHYARLQMDVAGNMLSAFNSLMEVDENGSRMIWNTPYSQFIRGELTLGKTWVWNEGYKHALATRFLAGVGYAYGNSSALPFEKHFYAGGSNSMRGWQARTVGPGTAPMDDSFIIPNQTGDMRLEANVEYRFNIIWNFYGAAFVDVGNVWTLQSSDSEEASLSQFKWNTFGRSLAANWGFGLRLDVDFLLLRVDLGLKIHDPSRLQPWVAPDQWLDRNGYAIHFGVGYPF
jgi:outer membrane protein assembly factor BamA